MQLQFQTVDVFTSDRFAGNPLAVVRNAEGLSAGRMQAIAAEFNLFPFNTTPMWRCVPVMSGTIDLV